MMDSYHTVWFELHEDLLATLGMVFFISFRIHALQPATALALFMAAAFF